MELLRHGLLQIHLLFAAFLFREYVSTFDTLISTAISVVQTEAFIYAQSHSMLYTLLSFSHTV